MRRLIFLIPFCLFMNAMPAHSEQDQPEARRDSPKISIEVQTALKKGVYDVRVTGKTLYPDGTFITVGVYPIRRLLLADQESTEAFQNTVKIVKGQWDTLITLPQDAFLPSYHIVKAHFTAERQPQSVKEAVLASGLSNDSCEAASILWIGTVDHTKYFLSRELEKMGDIVTRLDALILKITRKQAEDPAVPFTSEREELDRILSRSNADLDITPSPKAETERVIRKLYGLMSTDKLDNLPSESAPGGYRNAHAKQASDPPPEKKEKKGPSHANANPAPVDTTEGIKKIFVVEYVYIVATDLGYLNSGLNLDGITGGEWQTLYERYKKDTSVLLNLITELQESPAFSAAFKAAFDEKGRDALPRLLIQNARARMDDYDALIQKKMPSAEIKKDIGYLKKEKISQDTFEELMQKIRGKENASQDTKASQDTLEKLR